MSARFVASNGWEVEAGDLTDLDGESVASRAWGGWDALIEYGRHLERTERDKALGRWRSPTHPEYVVYSLDPGRISVLHEGACYISDYREERARRDEKATVFAEVAVEYFDAHKPDAHKPQEPKPWLDAKPGEVWVLTLDGDEFAWGVGDGVDAGKFIYAGGESNVPLNYPGITAGYRIWPVSETSEEQS